MARFLILFLMCAVIISLPVISFSQEDEAQDTEYSYGTVVEIKKEANQLVITEYDWDADQEIRVVYSISEDIKIENMDSWKNIPNGTYVDIEYVTNEKGEKVATYINVYEPEEEQE